MVLANSNVVMLPYICMLWLWVRFLVEVVGKEYLQPSVKTLRSPLSAEFWRHCVLSGRTQRRA